MSRRGAHVLFWTLAAVGLATDLVSKSIVFRFLSGQAYDEYVVWPGFFKLTRCYNAGGPWSILGGHRALLIVVTCVALAIILYLYAVAVRDGKTRLVAALGLITPGAMGNLLDRVASGAVRDFLGFTIFGYEYPFFNFADILITVGMFLLIIELFRRESPKPKREPTDA